ncbi:MAG: hypothetical protein PHC66_02865 [Candidatus Nanoarchaeia archaeon]|nr:hypothetical protein [Candidatus Nanoarchaeia archaeon]MDD5239004.1 hypothetical protein [Candidatus Nanoarchaeia archaeon]
MTNLGSLIKKPIRYLKKRSKVKREMRKFGKKHNLDFSYMKSGSKEFGYSIGKLCDMPKEERTEVYNEVNSVYLRNVEIGPVSRNPLNRKNPREAYAEAFENHSNHMIACDEEDAKGTTRIERISKQIAKAFKGFKKRHPRIVEVARYTAAIALGVLMPLSGINMYNDYHSYLCDDKTINVSTREAAKNMHFDELNLVEVKNNSSEAPYFDFDTGSGVLTERIDLTGVENLNGTSYTIADITRNHLRVAVNHPTDMDNLTEENVNKMFKDMGYNIQLKFDATKNETDDCNPHFSGTDGSIDADAHLSKSSDNAEKTIVLHIKYDIHNETQIREVLDDLHSKKLVTENADDLVKLIGEYPVVSNEEINKTLGAAKFVKYWELPNGEPSSNATEYIIKNGVNAKTNLIYDGEFEKWSKSNKDVLENGSLVEVLESIDDYVSMTSEYKTSEPRFMCVDYTDKYIFAFNEAKKTNKNMQGAAAFKVYSTKAVYDTASEGHVYVGVMSASGDNLYVSFVDPTFSDTKHALTEIFIDPYNTLTNGISEKENFDALDGTHHIAVNSSPKLEARAEAAKERAIITGGLQISAEIAGIAAATCAFRDKKSEKAKPKNAGG